MRKVTKDLNDIPEILIDEGTLSDLEEIANGNVDLISPRIYKGEYKDAHGKSQSTVRERLNKYYHSKCGYCERFCKAEIEHYRPKKDVREDDEHDGYFWLCYEWSNLIPSCRYCNTEGGKGIKFPIVNIPNRVREPNFVEGRLDRARCFSAAVPLSDENPVLLHPEIDNPKAFFGFELDKENIGVLIKELNNNIRGSGTIEICNLNRTELQLERLELYFSIVQPINNVFALVASGDMEETNLGTALSTVFKSLEDNLKNEKLTHTLLRWFIIDNVNNFETHFAPYIEDENQRAIVVEAFKLHKANQLGM